MSIFLAVVILLSAFCGFLALVGAQEESCKKREFIPDMLCGLKLFGFTLLCMAGVALVSAVISWSLLTVIEAFA